MTFRFDLIIRAFLFFSDVRVFQCEDWCFVSGPFWKIHVLSLVMTYSIRSGSAVNRTMMSVHAHVSVLVWCFWYHIWTNFGYFKILVQSFSYCLSVNVRHVCHHPNTLTSVYPHNFVNFLKVFINSRCQRLTRTVINFNVLPTFQKPFVSFKTSSTWYAISAKYLLQQCKTFSKRFFNFTRNFRLMHCSSFKLIMITELRQKNVLLKQGFKKTKLNWATE